MAIAVHDLNDNKPVFSQPTYFASVDPISSNYQKIADFKVTDKDSGDFGVGGLECVLLGNDAEK